MEKITEEDAHIVSVLLYRAGVLRELSLHSEIIVYNALKEHFVEERK